MSGYAKVIADSITEDGHRLTTGELRFRRFVLSEFNTHCTLDRNSASSRAIPVKKQLEAIERDLAYPEVWPMEQAGMQGGANLSMGEQQQARKEWESAARAAVKQAKALIALGVHKSVTNRLLEPFMWHTVCVTATAWQNFFGLRANSMAQPEIRVAAEAFKAAYDASTPSLLKQGEWHLPYVTSEDFEHWSMAERVRGDHWSSLVKVSSARVARTSYLTQDGKRDFDADLGLYERLTAADPMHASPLGQVATPAPWNVHDVEVAAVGFSRQEQTSGGINVVTPVKTLTLPMYGKLLGWHAHRFDVEIQRGYQSFS